MTDQHRDADDTVVHPPRHTGARVLEDTVLLAGTVGGTPPGPAPAPPLLGSSSPPPAPTAPTADRRVHGVLVSGRVHRLERPLVLGRRPAPTRVVRGAPPQLVSVHSPTGQVSGTHVEVRQEGDVVVVTDLRSTNGTRVTLPGRAPVALRQGESLAVLAGSLVDLGDGVVVEVLPPQRLTLEEGPRP